MYNRKNSIGYFVNLVIIFQTFKHLNHKQLHFMRTEDFLRLIFTLLLHRLLGRSGPDVAIVDFGGKPKYTTR